MSPYETLRQALAEMDHAHRDPGWFTKGHAGADAQFRLWRDRGLKALEEIAKPNPFQAVMDFERALCRYTGARYAVTTTSCTQALLMAAAWRLQAGWGRGPYPNLEIPKRTYVGVVYALREAGAKVTFRDDDWQAFGHYQVQPLPIWDAARWFSGGMFNAFPQHAGVRFVCVSFHWLKTLGIQQGGAILHDDPEADAWLRKARFDGRTEGVAPADDVFSLQRAWHAYMAPETAAAGLVRLAALPQKNAPIPEAHYPDLSKAFQ